MVQAATPDPTTASGVSPEDAFRTLRRQLKYLTRRQVRRVERAFFTSHKAHAGQTRKSGEPYIHHPIEVAEILARMTMDDDTIAAALLHDTVEDTSLTLEQVEEEFGGTVAALVDGVTKLEKVDFSTRQMAAAESFRKMFMAMSRDIRVILIKLADRLHNMRTIGAMSPDSRRRIALETLEVYAPIANRFGMENVRRELQELGFQALYPLRSRVIRDHVRLAEGRNQEKLAIIARALRKRLSGASIRCRVEARVKTPYSIYQKMRGRGGTFKNVSDILGFRIVVERVSQCYQVLGVVHNLYKPRTGSFKDYIAIPKSNGYQSLHTVLFGPYGDPVEIQIRTEAMHTVAERGIAAHWIYKENDDQQAATTSRARQWLMQVLDMQRTAGDSVEFLEHLKVDLFPDEIYVFTPNGAIKELPRNSTVLDFAFAVHTQVGLTATHAWVDKAVRPLHYRIESGQTIKVVTAPSAEPRASWLDFVVTSKARTAIRHHLKGLARADAVRVGHRILDKALVARGVSLDAISEQQLNAYLEEAKLEHLEDLLADLALGNRIPAIVARRLTEDMDSGEESSDEDLTEEALLLTGLEGNVVSYGKCCHPIPGDRVIGYISAGKGIVVHRISCANVREFRKFPDRLLDVAWDPEEKGLFSVTLRVDSKNRPGALATVAAAISETNTNIEQVANQERDGEASQLEFTISVAGRKHLARVMRRIKNSPVVLAVHRERN
ncbi:MAG: bifunctional (p)ppGpp synthetase/guanosine-3',5'-bis(diphosphate) 3'-pyrophosphohydrolase [Pseudomonadota bacterium]